jgi:hypothetical protein
VPKLHVTFQFVERIQDLGGAAVIYNPEADEGMRFG